LSDSIVSDRSAHLLMAAEDIEYDEARGRLERACLLLLAEEELDQASQAALLAATICGTRMFKGGVFVSPSLPGRLTIGQERPRPLLRALMDFGARPINAPDHAQRLSFGRSVICSSHLHVACDGWTARVGSALDLSSDKRGNILSGVAGGALGVSELFRKAVLGDVLATKREMALDLWGHGSRPDRIERLPKDVWLLGLGNLGQATLFVLSLLPWNDPAEASFVLNDSDFAGLENLPIQVLTRHDWVGKKKARCAAAWAEARGFRTTIEERLFSAQTRPGGTEPAMALVGVDNLDARRWAATAGFDLVVDAGLGASGTEAFDIRIHAFPGSRSASEVWPEVQLHSGPSLSRPLVKLVEQGRLDLCGAMTIAGNSVSLPCTALVAAAVQVAQSCRALSTGECFDRIDLSLADLRRTAWRSMPRPLDRRPHSVASLAA
jgi:hypothetical protein